MLVLPSRVDVHTKTHNHPNKGNYRAKAVVRGTPVPVEVERLPMSGTPRTGSFLNVLAERAVVAQRVTCERTR
jgi:hypothetical protein